MPQRTAGRYEPPVATATVGNSADLRHGLLSNQHQSELPPEFMLVTETTKCCRLLLPVSDSSENDIEAQQ